METRCFCFVKSFKATWIDSESLEDLPGDCWSVCSGGGEFCIGMPPPPTHTLTHTRKQRASWLRDEAKEEKEWCLKDGRDGGLHGAGLRQWPNLVKLLILSFVLVSRWTLRGCAHLLRLLLQSLQTRTQCFHNGCWRGDLWVSFPQVRLQSSSISQVIFSLLEWVSRNLCCGRASAKHLLITLDHNSVCIGSLCGTMSDQPKYFWQCWKQPETQALPSAPSFTVISQTSSQLCSV